jgi:hypothetical protein
VSLSETKKGEIMRKDEELLTINNVRVTKECHNAISHLKIDLGCKINEAASYILEKYISNNKKKKSSNSIELGDTLDE